MAESLSPWRSQAMAFVQDVAGGVVACPHESGADRDSMLRGRGRIPVDRSGRLMSHDQERRRSRIRILFAIISKRPHAGQR